VNRWRRRLKGFRPLPKCFSYTFITTRQAYPKRSGSNTNPTALGQFRHDLKTDIERQLDLFAGGYEYGDYFSLAEYETENSISEDEYSVFRSALGHEDRETALDELPTDPLQGFRAVMLHRVISGDLAEVRHAVDLFNFIIECSINAVDNQNPCSYIWIGTATEFGPSWIDRLFQSIESLKYTLGATIRTRGSSVRNSSQGSFYSVWFSAQCIARDGRTVI
jgi:hypothetical protein